MIEALLRDVLCCSLCVLPMLCSESRDAIVQVLNVTVSHVMGSWLQCTDFLKEV